MLRAFFFSVLCLSSLACLNPVLAQTRVKSGTLDCDVSGGVGLILGSNKGVRCYYTSNRGARETYVGSIKKYGLDIGTTERARLLWVVYAPTNYPPYALTGSYAGGTIEATIGGGVGANVLIGGNADTISLQPLSVSAQRGLNIAAGVGDLELVPAGQPRGQRYR